MNQPKLVEIEVKQQKPKIAAAKAGVQQHCYILGIDLKQQFKPEKLNKCLSFKAMYRW